jgi:triosephosphate isomerase
MGKSNTAIKNKKIVIANWKMNPSSGREAENLFKLILKWKPNKLRADIVICPPALYLERLYKISKKINLGVQNIFFGGEGASTGEISGNMAENSGAKYVILGHSERRAMGETDDIINKKIKTAFYVGLTPILCVGEKVRNETHDHFNVVKTQLENALLGVTKASISKLIVTYEPVWAVGDKALREARPAEFREFSIFIRKILSDKFGMENAQKAKIIYGGSVNPTDARGLLEEGGAEGLLVGRASLEAKKFIEIAEIVSNAVN